MKANEITVNENCALAIVKHNGKQTKLYYYIDKNTGNESLEVFQGERYIIGSSDKNYSRNYKSHDIPVKLQSKADDLRNALLRYRGLLPEIKAGDTIVISAKRWFDKTYGNTYHSVRVYLNDKELGFIPFEYGYESHYLQTAKKILERETMFTVSPKYLDVRTLEEMGVTVVNNVTDVNRKKDLQNLY